MTLLTLIATTALEAAGRRSASFWKVSGAPSVSHADGFRINASQIISHRIGTLLYSKLGADSKPFAGGVLCVASPVYYTRHLSSGGNSPPPDCSGWFDFDFSAYLASGIDPYLAPGWQVWAQFWYRDPGSSNGTGLTDALHFTLCP